MKGKKEVKHKKILLPSFTFKIIEGGMKYYNKKAVRTGMEKRKKRSGNKSYSSGTLRLLLFSHNLIP